MKKLFFAAAMALMVSGSAWAAHQLLVNGETVDKVVKSITFDGDNAVLHFGDDSQAYDMEAVELHFSGTSDISQIETSVFTGIVGDVLTVEGLDGVTSAEIYNLQGVRLAQKAVVEGRAEFSLGDFSSGVFILRAGNQIVKFVK